MFYNLELWLYLGLDCLLRSLVIYLFSSQFCWKKYVTYFLFVQIIIPSHSCLFWYEVTFINEKERFLFRVDLINILYKILASIE